MDLELITHRPVGRAYPTPILFVHGLWHGAWCWDEFFLPYFAAQGFVAQGFSFRSHGRSPPAGALRWQRGADYVADLAQMVGQIGQAPVLVGHSLGGYVVQKYLEQARVPATVLLAPVPPQGALGATIRTARRHPLAFLQANLQLRMWPIIGSRQRAREAFFSPGMPADLRRRYYAQMQDDAYRAYLDILALNLPRLRRVQRGPMLVLGGADDALFTPAELRATARAYHAQGAILAGMAHDLMLEGRWAAVAERIITWLRGVPGVC